METALIAFGGVVLGWVLGAGTQLLRDRRQAQIALMLIHNELIGNIAQLDLAQTQGIEDEGVYLSHWSSVGGCLVAPGISRARWRSPA